MNKYLKELYKQMPKEEKRRIAKAKDDELEKKLEPYDIECLPEKIDRSPENEMKWITHFRTHFPELEAEVQEELTWRGTDELPGLHNFMGDVFNPYLVEKIKKGKDKKFLKRAFDYIEAMLLSKDSYWINVGIVTVCEGIVFGGKDVYLKSLNHAHPVSKIYLDYLYDYFYITRQDLMF